MYIRYFILFFLVLALLLFLNIQISKNIKFVRDNFNNIELEMLNEISSNITGLISENITQEGLYETLNKDKHLKKYIQYALAVIVNKKYKYAYIVQKKNQYSFRYLLDGSLSEESIIGELFFGADSAWSTIYQTKEPIILKENELEDIGLTYLYPIIINDKVEAILAIDFSKKKIKETMRYLDPMEDMLHYSVIILFIIVSLLAIFVILWFKKNKESNRRKIELEKNECILKDATHQAQSANIAKSEFLANMSHEIRTPMNAIVGLNDLMLKTSLDTKQKDYILKIKQSTSSLLSIINDILDFSKIEAGKLELESREFAIIDVVSKIRTIFDTSTKIDNVKFELFLGEGLPLYFIGDIVRLEQVIINLLSNAFKFTSKGSVALYIDYDKDAKNNLKITIQDTGIGIAEENIPTLFDNFTQADNSITRTFGGTGLGLSISKQIISLYNGDIEVTSEVDVGTTFIVRLNLEVYHGKSFKKKVYNIQNNINFLAFYRDIDILIAEDNHINQDVIKGYLEDFDFNITIVENGLECVNEFKNKKYDLIIMDINMPIMSGYEATKLIRKNDKNTPIIALSANVIKKDYNKSIDVGMNDHIGKPIDVNLLYESLKKYLPTSKIFQSSSAIRKELSSCDIYYFESIDSESAIKKLNYNNALYKNILKKYYEDYHHSIVQLTSMNQEMKKEFFHKLKSTSGVIGADNLHKKIELYNSIDANDNALYREIVEEMYKVNNELKTFFNSEVKEKTLTEQNITNQDDIKLIDALTKLNAALKTKRTKLIKISFENFRTFAQGTKHEGTVENIEPYISMCNFTQALKIIEELG